MKYFYIDRENLAKELKPKLQQELFSAAGYYLNDGKYTAAASYLRSTYEKQKNKFRSLITKHVSKAIFAKNGYLKDGIIVKKDSSVTEEDASKAFSDLEAAMFRVLGEVEQKKALFDPAFYDADF